MSMFDFFRKEKPKESAGPLCRSAIARGRWIALPKQPTDSEIRLAIVTWIEQMARGEYGKAVSSVFSDPPSPENFREQVETSSIEVARAREQVVNALREKVGKEVHAPPAPKTPLPATRGKVVLPSSDVLDAMEIHREGIPSDAVAWVGFHVPLDNGFRLWTTMGVMRAGNQCVLEFEIFHL